MYKQLQLLLLFSVLLLTVSTVFAEKSVDAMPMGMPNLDNATIIGPKGIKLSKAKMDSLLENGYQMIHMMGEHNQATAFVFKEKADLKGLIPDEIYSQLPEDMSMMGVPPAGEHGMGMPPGGGMMFDSKDNPWSTKPMIDFTASDYKDFSINSEKLRGKVVVLKFWFIGCKPCIIEMPELNKLVEKYKGKDVVFIAPTFDTKESLDKFFSTTENKFNYQILPASMELIQKYGVKSFPTHMVINKEGVVTDVVQGSVQGIEDMLSGFINEALLF